MKLILSLKASDCEINIYVPPMGERINHHYGKSTRKIHKFDEALCVYESKGQKIVLSEDTLAGLLWLVTFFLDKAREENLKLPFSTKPQEMSKTFSIDRYQQNYTTEYKNWLAFSQEDDVETWIYTLDDMICFEISRSYSWLFKIPRAEEQCEDFETYCKNYQPEAFFCIDEKTAQRWLVQCYKLAQKLETKTICG